MNIICKIFGHKWKKELFTSRGSSMDGHAIVERCSRCKILNNKDWTKK